MGMYGAQFPFGLYPACSALEKCAPCQVVMCLLLEFLQSSPRASAPPSPHLRAHTSCNPTWTKHEKQSFRQCVAVGHHARDVVWLSDQRPRHTGKSFAENSSSDTPSAGLGGVRLGQRLADRSRHSPSYSRVHARTLLFDAVDSLLSSASDLLTSSAPSASSKVAARVSSRP